MIENRSVIDKWILEYDTRQLPVTVPGDVCNDLFENGIIEDALFADNYKRIEWVHERDWTYNTEFELTKENLKNEIYLEFFGIDTFADIYLNGNLIASNKSMFTHNKIKISEWARETNKLSVKIFAIREIAKSYSNDKYGACFHDERIFFRKIQCHFGWDWAPNFPGVGIFDKVELILCDEFRIQDIKIDAFNDGHVSFITNLSYYPIKGQDEIEITICYQKQKIKSRSDVLGKKNITNAFVNNVQLWYPNGYGLQPIYNYEVRVLRNNKTIASATGKFAFRSVSVIETPRDTDKRDFALQVNGVPFKVIGSNWVPASIMTGCVTRERYRVLLQYAKDAGVTMLRVWGGGFYEKDDFYDICDELGIAIWQDFMFSCCDVPDDNPAFRDMIEQEAREQIIRLRNHPCIALWCGGNELSSSFRPNNFSFGEYIIRVMLPGLVYELDGSRKYVWDSPYSLTQIGDDSNSGDCHKNALAVATANNDIFHYRKYQWNNDNAFDSECAVLGMCRLRSFKKMMPENKIWPQNELWEDRLSCNPYDDSVVSFTERINMNVESMFGKTDHIEDYIKYSMTVHAEVLRGEIEYFRALPYNYGIMNWMYNDIWGNGTWALVDFYLEKKPAYYAMKRAGARQSISYTYHRDGYYLNVINDTKDKLCGNLCYFQIELAGDELWKLQREVNLKPFSQLSVKVDFKEVKNAFLYAELGGLNTVYFYDLWKDKHFETDINVSTKLISETQGEIAIVANSFARMVFIDFPDGIKVNLSDNYFDIPGGRGKLVSFKTDKKINREDISVLTFADKWND